MNSLKTNYLVIFFSLLAFFCTVSNSHAQRKPKRSNVSSITGQKFKLKKKRALKKKQINYINSIKGIFGVGIANYSGDLCSGFGCTKPRPSVVAGVEYRLDESITLRSELTWVRIAGDDASGNAEYRNLSFRSDNFELTAVAMYDVFHYEKMYRRRHFASPYFFAGIGLTTVNPKTEFEGTYYSLRKLNLNEDSYGMLALVVPYGGGVKFKINPLLNLTAEVGMRWVFSDYLDDASGKYRTEYDSELAAALGDRRTEYLLEKNLIANESKAEISKFSEQDPVQYNLSFNSSDRGGSDRNDGYMVFQIKAEYTLKVTRQHYNINSNSNRFRLVKSIKRR